MLSIKISVAVAEKSLRTTIPLIGPGLALVEKNGGRTFLPEGLVSRFKLLHIERWAELYLDPSKVIALSLLGIYTREQLDQIGDYLATSTEEDQARFWESLIDYASTENWMDKAAGEYVAGMTPEEMRQQLEEAFKVGGQKLKEDTALHIQAAFTSITISSMSFVRAKPRR